MSSAMLKKNIPRQQIFEVVWRPAFEHFHGFIARESGVVDSSNEGTQRRVVVQCAELVSDIHKSLYLFCAVL